MNDKQLKRYLTNRRNELEQELDNYEQKIRPLTSIGVAVDDTPRHWLQARTSEIDRLFAYLEIIEGE